MSFLKGLTTPETCAAPAAFCPPIDSPERPRRQPYLESRKWLSTACLVLVAWKHNPLLRAMGKRFATRGEPKMVVMYTLMRKLLTIAYEVLRSFSIPCCLLLVLDLRDGIYVFRLCWVSGRNGGVSNQRLFGVGRGSEAGRTTPTCRPTFTPLCSRYIFASARVLRQAYASPTNSKNYKSSSHRDLRSISAPQIVASPKYRKSLLQCPDHQLNPVLQKLDAKHLSRFFGTRPLPLPLG